MRIGPTRSARGVINLEKGGLNAVLKRYGSAPAGVQSGQSMAAGLLGLTWPSRSVGLASLQIVAADRRMKEAYMRRRALVVATTTTLALGLAAGHAIGGGTTVKAVNFAFKRKAVTIQKGGKVTWKNVQGKHTVTFKNGSFDKVISGDERVSKKFRHRGTFRYICRFHIQQGMRGKVIVK
jgi:plastocyanin